jgi:hypothetical protein
VFFVSTWRLITGIKHPWLFQYAFSQNRVYDAVHAVEINYFPKSLTYVDLIYIITPIYASIIYACNAFIVAVSASLRNYETLKIVKNVSTGMTVPGLVMVAFFGKIFTLFPISTKNFSFVNNLTTMMYNFIIIYQLNIGNTLLKLVDDYLIK